MLDIGNEIQQLEKQYSKLPDLFKSKVLPVYEERLDSRLSIKTSSFESRIKINNPSYHWCMAKLYLLSNDTMKLRAHYARYLSLIDTDNDVPLLFKQPIPVTELMSSSLLQKKLNLINKKKILVNSSLIKLKEILLLYQLIQKNINQIMKNIFLVLNYLMIQILLILKY